MSPATPSRQPVEIWFKIQKDAAGNPKTQDWEDLWSVPLEGGVFRVASTPFYVTGVASGDVVLAVRTEEGWYRFERVVSRSGNSNFRIFLHDGVVLNRGLIVQVLRELGCHVEVTLERLVAVDVPADREAEVWEYLQAGVTRDDWGLQVGFSPERVT